MERGLFIICWVVRVGAPRASVTRSGTYTLIVDAPFIYNVRKKYGYNGDTHYHLISIEHV